MMKAVQQDLPASRHEAPRLRDLIEATRRWLISSSARGDAAQDILDGVQDFAFRGCAG